MEDQRGRTRAGPARPASVDGLAVQVQIQALDLRFLIDPQAAGEDTHNFEDDEARHAAPHDGRQNAYHLDPDLACIAL